MADSLLSASGLPPSPAHHYAGRWQTPLHPETLPVFCPATGSELTLSAAAGPADVAAACAAASAALPAWCAMDALDWGRILRRLADLVASRIDMLAALESATIGRPLREMRAQMGRIPEWIEYFAGIAPGLEAEAKTLKGHLLSYTAYEPYGVCALLTPWNHPILILVKKLAAALAAGNACIVKPSELAPISTLVFAQWCAEAGLPAGTVNVVVGDGRAGALVCAAPEVQRIDMTGGTATGRRVAAAAAERLVPCTLELGGKTPFVVFEDVDVAEAAAGAVFAAFIAAGQTCVSASRLLVARPIYEAFSEALRDRVEALRVGNPADAATDVGPVISAASKARSLGHIDKARAAGAPILAGGALPELGAACAGGYFVPPTVFRDVEPHMDLFREEVFGPVISVTPFDTEADALRLANDPPTRSAPPSGPVMSVAPTAWRRRCAAAWSGSTTTTRTTRARSGAVSATAATAEGTPRQRPVQTAGRLATKASTPLRKSSLP
nr:aldehyde dehydrogenase family protein [Phreatobacter sp.]